MLNDYNATPSLMYSRAGVGIKKQRFISLKSGKQESSSSFSSRRAFKSTFSTFDMKQVKQLTEHIAPESHVAPQRSHRVSPSKNKKSQKGISKNVSFVEPEVENGSKKSLRKIKRLRSRNPLVPSNLDNENCGRNVSNARTFKKSVTVSANPEPCYASKLHPAIAVITKTEVQFALANESLTTTDSNGVDSNVSSPRPDRPIPPSDAEAMGFNFNDDSDNLSGHQLSVKLQKQSVDLDNCGARSEHSADSPSLTGSNLASITNINCNNINNPTNQYQRSSDAVKSSDIIREEIRLRRSLFFGSPDIGSELRSNSRTSEHQEDYLNMNGYAKSTHFGFRQTTDRKFVSSSSQGLARFETSVSPSKSSGLARSTEMNLPKLYSVHNIQQQPNGHGLKSSQSVTHVTQTSKLPTFSSGSNIRSNASSTASIKTTNANQRCLYSRMPVQSLRSVKHVESTADDATGQWVSGNEFFKPRPTTNESKAAESRRETMPTRFGNGNSNGMPGCGIPGRKSSPESQTNNEIRRGSVYSSLGSKLPTYNSGVKKPVESVPFYMMNLYKNRNNPSSTSAVTLESKHGLPSSQSAGFSGVSTGVVKQRTIQYQSKIAEQSSNHGSPPSPLVRSSTYVKSTSPLAPDSNTPVIDSVHRVSDSPKSTRNEDNNGKNSMSTRKSLPMTGIPSPRTPRLRYSSPSDNKENCKNASPKGQHRSFAKTTVKKPLSRPPQEAMPVNFPLARDGSTSSSIVSTFSSEEHSSCGSGYATADADKAISDSEFLIDDEISDQPDLTLTFKDSSLILSPSSSGESLISCDLMLDYKDSSCSGLVPGDSVLLVDEPCLGGSGKESSGRKSNLRIETTSSSGVPQINMVNTTSANSSRRSLGSLQGQNGSISPIATSTPYSANKQLSKGSNLSGRGMPNQHPSHSGSRLILYQQNHSSSTGNIQRHGKYSGVPIPSASPAIETNVVENSSITENQLVGSSPGNTKLRAFNSRSPQRQSIGTPKSTSTKVPSPIVSSPKSVKHRRNEVTSNHHNKESQENLENSISPDSVSDNFIKEIVTEVVEYKNKLKELLTVLETNERDMSDKDEVIRKQQQEIEFWKSRYTEAVKKAYDDTDTEDSVISHNYEADSWHKEKQVTLRKDMVNSAVQTESNYPSRAAVTYPEEHDKMGQLVSFRIGRRSSSSNKN
ncbi:unnamed protein product [Allacma fusca]|uniref:Uncharacterized protein n=1 Tax=Allacma fusca TaxID=39272 RepID=A0A8J2MGD6_9HEXA|nr:unnamed protein product [Allacma fusca]